MVRAMFLLLTLWIYLYSHLHGLYVHTVNIWNNTSYITNDVNSGDQTSYIATTSTIVFDGKDSSSLEVILGNVSSCFINKWRYLGNATSYNGWLVECRMCSIKWRYYKWLMHNVHFCHFWFIGLHSIHYYYYCNLFLGVTLLALIWVYVDCNQLHC